VLENYQPKGRVPLNIDIGVQNSFVECKKYRKKNIGSHNKNNISEIVR